MVLISHTFWCFTSLHFFISIQFYSVLLFFNEYALGRIYCRCELWALAFKKWSYLFRFAKICLLLNWSFYRNEDVHFQYVISKGHWYFPFAKHYVLFIGLRSSKENNKRSSGVFVGVCGGGHLGVIFLHGSTRTVRGGVLYAYFGEQGLPVGVHECLEGFQRWCVDCFFVPVWGSLNGESVLAMVGTTSPCQIFNRRKPIYLLFHL